MISQRTMKWVLIALGVLALAALIANLPDNLKWVVRSRGVGLIGMGMVHGTLSSIVAMAAFWTVVGTPPVVTRIGQALAGLVAAWLALFVNALLAGELGRQTWVMLGMLAVAAVTLWPLLAGPLWLLTANRSIRLRHVRELSLDVQAADQQFGIREILVVTATTAVLLGAVRWLIEIQPLAEPGIGEGMVLIAGIVVFNIFVILPLLIAPLLRRFALVATLMGLLLIAVGTAVEIPIAQQLGPLSKNESVVIWALNCTQAAWVLMTLGTLRLGGYRLAAAGTSNARQACEVAANGPSDST